MLKLWSWRMMRSRWFCALRGHRQELATTDPSEDHTASEVGRLVMQSFDMFDPAAGPPAGTTKTMCRCYRRRVELPAD
jgi:hypothetical protein